MSKTFVDMGSQVQCNEVLNGGTVGSLILEKKYSPPYGNGLISNVYYEYVDFCGYNLQCDFVSVVFDACDFSGFDMKEAKIIDCHFKNIDFSTTIFKNANFISATFEDCVFWGFDFTKKPLKIEGLRWKVLILEHHIQIGNCVQTTEEWKKSTGIEINKNYPEKTDKFWEKHKNGILTLAEEFQRQ